MDTFGKDPQKKAALTDRFRRFGFSEDTVEQAGVFWERKEQYFVTRDRADYAELKNLYDAIDAAVKQSWEQGNLSYDDFYEFRRLLREDLY